MPLPDNDEGLLDSNVGLVLQHYCSLDDNGRGVRGSHCDLPIGNGKPPTRPWRAISGITPQSEKLRGTKRVQLIINANSCKDCGTPITTTEVLSRHLCPKHRATFWQNRLQFPSRRRLVTSLTDDEIWAGLQDAPERKWQNYCLERARRILKNVPRRLRKEIAKHPFSVYAAAKDRLSPNAHRIARYSLLYDAFHIAWCKYPPNEPTKTVCKERTVREERPIEDPVHLREALGIMMSGPLTLEQYKRTFDGLSIRNLLLTTQAASKPHYFDDASILGRDGERRFDALSPRSRAFKSELERSQSAVDLKFAANADAVANGRPSGELKRPASRRRLSTVGWWHESGRARQQLLEDALSHRRPNTFFTIHPKPGPKKYKDVLHSKLVFYVSETVSQSMNLDFRFFNASPYDLNASYVCMLQGFTLKVWVKPNSFVSETEDFYLLLEMDVNISGLRKVADTLDGYPHPFPHNTVIFHMSDGVYVNNLEVRDISAKGPAALSRASTFAPRGTSSFDELMKLRDTTECIDDAIQTRLQLAKDISKFLSDHKASTSKTVSAASAPATIKDHADALSDTRRHIKKLQSHVSASEQKITARRTIIADGNHEIDVSSVTVHQHLAAIFAIRRSQSTNRPILGSQVRRVARTLIDIFPITPIAGAPLCFRVGGLYLPSAATFSYSTSQSPSRAPASAPRPDDDTTAAALGHAAFVVHYLATQLGIAVPYPLTPRGSTSEVFDPLTPASQLNILEPVPKPTAAPTPLNSPQRVYVLSRRVSTPGRFPWAVYLLNKDLEELARRCALKVVDPRNTAANLKYVLEVLSSGTGPVGKREPGDIAAFLRGSAEAGAREFRHESELSGSDAGPSRLMEREDSPSGAGGAATGANTATAATATAATSPPGSVRVA